MQRSKERIITYFEQNYPPGGTLGHYLLLTNTPVTSDITAVASSTITIAGGTGIGDGAIVRFSTTGTLPTGISSGVNYWVKALGGNDFDVYPTYDDWAALTNKVTVTGMGTGTSSLIEQAFTEANYANGWISKQSLIAKESAHSEYVRKPATYSASQWDDTLDAAFFTQTITYTLTTPLSFRFILLLDGGTVTTGNLTGDPDVLIDTGVTQTINGTQPYTITIGASGRNP